MSLFVVKLGGGAGVDQAAVLENLAARVKNGERWVLVHGASDATNKLAAVRGIEQRTITSPGGHVSRYTDAATIAVYAEAARAVNQQIATTLRAAGIGAEALATAGIVRAERKKAIRALHKGRQMVIRDDYSGKITGLDADALRAILDAGAVPVVPPLAVGEEDEDLNVDGDLTAATIARQLGADTLIILSNVPGLLRDVTDPASVVPGFKIHALRDYEHLAEGRMKKKLIAAQEADVPRVILADSRVAAPLDAALAGGGTHITGETDHGG
ncbi:MAG: [LysW]-aminoadipate kinase [Anaerolineales bacterium]